MPLKRMQGPDGPYYVRPAYRAEDYRVDPNALKAIENWRGETFGVEALLTIHDGPFTTWREVARFDRDGRAWIRFAHLSGEYCVDVEVKADGLGEVLTVDPRGAYDAAVDADSTRALRVVRE